MKFCKVMTVIGVILIGLAWFTAADIPEAASKDFSRLVQRSGGSLSHTPNFPDAYKQLSGHARMLQNFYVGGTGLICLAIGLSGWRRDSESSMKSV